MILPFEACAPRNVESNSIAPIFKNSACWKLNPEKPNQRQAPFSQITGGKLNTANPARTTHKIKENTKICEDLEKIQFNGIAFIPKKNKSPITIYVRCRQKK